MIMFWIFLGAFMASAFWYLATRFQQRGLPLGAWILATIMVLAFAFTLSWTATSLAAGEAQSAGMGLLIFGAISVILLIALIRIVGKNPGKGKHASDLNI